MCNFFTQALWYICTPQANRAALNADSSIQCKAPLTGGCAQGPESEGTIWIRAG